MYTDYGRTRIRRPNARFAVSTMLVKNGPTPASNPALKAGCPGRVSASQFIAGTHLDAYIPTFDEFFYITNNKLHLAK